jgi:predicted RNA-binding protein YlqC (UPF0109 family)
VLSSGLSALSYGLASALHRRPCTTGGDPTAIIELVEHMAKAIVDNPDQVRVHGITGESLLIIELRVATEDIGKVIGKHGRTITAMRTILHATRAQKDKRHVLEVLD